MMQSAAWSVFLAAFYAVTSVTEWLVHVVLHVRPSALPPPIRGWAESHMRHHSSCTPSTLWLQRCGVSDSGTWFDYGHCAIFVALIVPPCALIGRFCGLRMKACVAAATALVWAQVGAHNYAHARNHQVALGELPFVPRLPWNGVWGWLPRVYPLPLLPWVPKTVRRAVGEHHLRHHAGGGNYGVLLLGADWLFGTAKRAEKQRLEHALNASEGEAVHFPRTGTVLRDAQCSIVSTYAVFYPADGHQGLRYVGEGQDHGTFRRMEWGSEHMTIPELDKTVSYPRGKSRGAVLRRLLRLATGAGVQHNVLDILDTGKVILEEGGNFPSSHIPP
eukprot:Hpha_TRINITY_DN17915_c0_g1::TRINITY_DN17915_c0_g1_i1::g.33815::m.33815